MQIFPRSINAIAPASMVLTVLAVAGLFWAMVQVERSPYITYAGVRKSQPVPFSHQHHVTGLGIGCASTSNDDKVSTIPWNRPQSWEGTGALGGFRPPGSP